jgi:hypothetical protein
MSTKSLIKSVFNVPRISIYDYQKKDQVSLSQQQKKALIELVYQNIFDEDDLEMYISQINDDSMTSEEGRLMALDFEMARWR